MPASRKWSPPTRGSGMGERGSSSVEWAVLFPVIVVLLFAGPQLALWYFAREAVDAAAQAGARAASVLDAPSAVGEEAAGEYLAQLGSGAISSYSISQQESTTSVSVRVQAEVPNVIPLPGFDPTVDVTVVRLKERFTTPDSP